MTRQDLLCPVDQFFQLYECASVLVGVLPQQASLFQVTYKHYKIELMIRYNCSVRSNAYTHNSLLIACQSSTTDKKPCKRPEADSELARIRCAPGIRATVSWSPLKNIWWKSSTSIDTCSSVPDKSALSSLCSVGTY